ncbi:SDR family oxidoreductase [Microcoleus sp. FACHB-68]|uniref:SDR family oxidoreductase n=1 Tax=Microcoleus sp. FACHB-68 TaxID=2692826 RepID=UPI00168590A4|nr:SDR family oxidoreductase [Microcoleus sp. FACHB-68]MBD1936930.1 SDR family oxidoreductase [Microcoleus sp. FACHB-68]
MKIAIIGCGYVGSAIARRWREFGHLVTATTTTQTRVAELEEIAQRVEVMKGNDAGAILSVIQDQDAVLLSVGAPGGDAYRESYLETAKTLVEQLKQTSSVKQLIYTGSYSVYGDKNGEWVDEETPVAPANENGEILSETEQVLLGAAGENLKVCILRLGGIYGPDRELVKIFSRAAGTTRPGAGEDRTNWIRLEDIVGSIDFALTKQLQGIYNLVHDVPLTSREVIDRVCERHNLEKVSWDTSARSTRPYNAQVSNQKIKAAGYTLIYPEMLL